VRLKIMVSQAYLINVAFTDVDEIIKMEVDGPRLVESCKKMIE
jgi:hypothetical protein